MNPFELQAHNPRLEEAYLCLDFANTVNWHASQNPIEELTSFPALVDWFKQKGLLREAEADRLVAEAGGDPAAAGRALQQARDLREAIYRILTARAAGLAPASEDLALLNRELAASFQQLRLVSRGEGFTWAWEGEPAGIQGLLAEVARSAAQLLTSDEIQRVGQCADDRGCGWLFFDATKNHSRRWCSMESCGNRAKAQRHYHRQG